MIGHAPRLVNEAPALTTPTWLPTNSGIEWLDALGTDHQRLLAARRSTAHELSTLPERFEQEDYERREALASGFRTGNEPDLPPAMTAEERRAALAAAEERVGGANAALDSFLREAIVTIEERAAEALSLLAAHGQQAATKRAEAQRLLAEAAALEAHNWRLTEWVTRNAGQHARRAFRNVPTQRYVGWDTVQSLTPPPPLQEDGMGGLRPQIVDTFPGAEQFARNLNRGTTPPFEPNADDVERTGDPTTEEDN